MKFIALLLSVFTISAQAAEHKLEPIRMAKVTGKISRLHVTVDRDGSFTIDVKDVCSIQKEIPVYDIRGLDEYSYQSELAASCGSKVDGVPVEVQVVGEMVLTNDTFAPAPGVDAKMVSLRLSAYKNSNKPARMPNGTKIFAGTRDLNASSIVVSGSEKYDTESFKGGARDFFSFDADITDDAR